MYQHLLLPTDGSELSEKSINDGIELAKRLGARVTGLAVVVDTRVAAGIGKSMRDKEAPVQVAEEHLAIISRRAREVGVPCECYYVVGTWPHEEIMKAAVAKGCDLIHMASHGKGLLAGLFLGSEAARVVAGSKVPVLVVR